jgi:starch synthase
MLPLSVIHVASEVHPFTKTGGLADVTRSLPKALARLVQQIAIFTPYYQALDYTEHKLELILPELPIQLPDGSKLAAKVWRGELQPNLPVYLIEQAEYFGKERGIYGDPNDNRRFYIFSLCVLSAIQALQLKPHIIHCHDWQTGLIPYLLRSKHNGQAEKWQGVRTVFTIHNLTFQFGHNWWEVPNELRDSGRTALPEWWDEEAWERVNFAKRAIMQADFITTVSEQYAEEILTKDFGQDLHRILVNRKHKLAGIINGLDYRDYNPATDPGLIANYDITTLDRKYENKRHLQKIFGLSERAHVPLIGMVTRLSEQKGFDLLIEILEPLLRLDVQLVVMGGGDKHYSDALKKSAKKHPTKFGIHMEFDAKHATQVYAGSDMFLMPSRFEPCGLGQLISLRYGSIPIVHATGGLADTIEDYNPRTQQGNGFVFRAYDPRDLLVAITRATVNYRYSENWRKIVEQGMRQSFSWLVPAKKYLMIYKRLLRLPLTTDYVETGLV